jgi:hypothetical protein
MTPMPSTLQASLRSWFLSDGSPPSGPAWLQWLWTLAFSAVLAAVITVFGFAMHARDAADWLSGANWARWYGRNLLVALVVGLLIHGLFALVLPRIGAARIARLSGPARFALYGGLPLAGVAIGWPLGVALLAQLDDPVVARLFAGSPVDLLRSLLLGSLISAVLYFFFDAKARQALAEQRATHAQLRLLQAQMEPHFLFNTLANVQALMAHDVPRARRMLESFTDYLRSSLGGLRREQATLADELELARRYLALQQVRMEDRLQVRFEVEPGLEDAAIEPLTLQPLVENAVLHGAEPRVGGAVLAVRVRAQAASAGAARQLVVEVEDTSIDADERAPARGSGGNGLALANLRERLAARHGTRASLQAGPTPRGWLAVLQLPCDRSR